MATNTSTLDEIYAGSLIQLALNSGKLDEVGQEMEDLLTLINEQADLMRLLGNRVLSKDVRKDMIDRLFKDKVTDITYKFLQVVNQKGRLDRLPEICTAFAKLLLEARGIKEVDITTAAALTPEDMDRVSASLGSALKSEVKLNLDVQPDMIGGIKLRIGDTLVDGSVAAQLRILRQKMLVTGDVAAQHLADTTPLDAFSQSDPGTS